MVAQLVESLTPGQDVVAWISVLGACSLLVGLVSVLCDVLRQRSWSPLLSPSGST